MRTPMARPAPAARANAMSFAASPTTVTSAGRRPVAAQKPRISADDLTRLFNPMYSAYDGEHEFKMPAIVQGVQEVKWSARPANAIDLTPDSATGGVLITMRKAGKVLIIARADFSMVSRRSRCRLAVRMRTWMMYCGTCAGPSRQSSVRAR